jgi:hypothetical protein
MSRVVFDTFTVEVPFGWGDITDTVASDNPPYTLAHRDGVGALQFSLALWQGGRLPNPSPSDLLEMVERFGKAQDLGEPSFVITETGPPVLAAGSFAWGSDFLRVGQVSDGRNFAFITYTCAAESAGPELLACEQIVRSIAFRSG